METNGKTLVERAAEFAAWAHEGQVRKGEAGLPYVVHPQDVHDILVAHGVTDEVTLAAAWLHDTVEDCKAKGVTHEMLVEKFGPEVAGVVAEVTDIPGTKSKGKSSQVKRAPTMTPRAKLLKLADKTSNVRSLVKNPPGWKPAGVRGYVESATNVVRALGQVNEGLEAAFFVAAGEALASVA